MLKHVAEGDKILHIGAGNSLLAEQILGDERFPSRLSVMNVDVSEVAVERMNEHLDTIFGPTEAVPEEAVATRGKKQKSRAKKPELARPPGTRLWSRSQISYVIQDVSAMPYEDGSWDVVLDKGMLDAVLSHGEVETGDNDLVQRVNREVYRVLKDRGLYLIISGMDSFLTMPYFAGDELVNWDVSVHSFQSRSPSLKTLRTLFFYVLRKLPMDEIPAVE